MTNRPVQNLPISLSAALGPVLGLLLLLGPAGCMKNRGGPPVFPPSSVQSAQAVRMDAPILIAAFGTTDSRASVDVVPQVSGILTHTYVQDGAVVTNGQPLFEIDPRDYALRVQQAESQLAADQASLTLSTATLARNRTLREQNLISAEDFETIQARVAAATAQIQADQATLEQARLNLARCTITAPLGGICSRRYLDTGNLAAAGQNRLINIRSYDPIQVDFSVSEQYLPILRQALQAGPVPIAVIPRGETNRYPGVVTFLNNAVSSQTGTILLRGEIPNADLKLWAQQFVQVSVVAGQVRDAVLVPEGAVQFGKMGNYLYAITSTNTADLRVVKTGIRVEDRIQIEQGVAPGERVIVLGQMMLRPGAPVLDLSQQAAR